MYKNAYVLLIRTIDGYASLYKVIGTVVVLPESMQILFIFF